MNKARGEGSNRTSGSDRCCLLERMDRGAVIRMIKRDSKIDTSKTEFLNRKGVGGDTEERCHSACETPQYQPSVPLHNLYSSCESLLRGRLPSDVHIN